LDEQSPQARNGANDTAAMYLLGIYSHSERRVVFVAQQMLERIRGRRDFLKEHEMNTQPQTPGSQSAYAVLMIVGGTLLLLALGGSLALYFWG